MRSVLGLVFASLLCPFSAQAATGLISVDVSLGDITINKVPFLMAADNGIYERNGLEVHQFITPNAAELARRSGVFVPPETVRENIDSAPLAVGGGSPAIYNTVYMGGIDRVVLLSLENTVRSHIIAAADIRTVEDLRGKRLGYSNLGRANHIGLLSFARRMGWIPGTDIILVERANTISDITDGRADATLAGAVLVALAPEAGLNDVVDLGQYDLPFAGSGIMAERGWLRANRGAAARFVKAALEALALLKTDRAAFDASVAKWLNITDGIARDHLYAEAMKFPEKPYPSAQGIRTIMEIYDSPEMRAYSAEDFYDSSFIEELDRSGILDALYR
jgi:ABC-type nitrate/sulfonate/bicarbonate transport system substrate-binding protein